MSQRNTLRPLKAVLWSLLLAGMPAFAADQSVYGALYQAGHLEGESSANGESVMLYYPEEDGFIALTTNDDGAEWWTSDALGLNWSRLDAADNPLTDYSCRQPGRHAAVLFNGTYYFGASCTEGGSVFKLTGIDSAERVHVKLDQSEGTSFGSAVADGNNPPPGDDGEDLDGNPNNGDQPGGDQPNGGEVSGGYPTATVLNDVLYLFYQGGYTQCGTDDVCVDVEDAANQPSDVPLEVSAETDGLIYAAFTDGSVLSFDGTGYETIGQVEGVTNLPAIEVYNGDIYVGDLNNEGASLYRYNEETGEFDVVLTLESDDTIVNKMQLSDEIDGKTYLTFYTANAEVGSRILAVDENGDVIQLVDSGLGGENPENNAEVVSIVNRTVMDGTVEKQIQLFGTKNDTDQTKVFVLNMGTELDVPITSDSVVVPPVKNDEDEETVDEGDEVVEGQALFALHKVQKKGKAKGKVKLTRGQALKVIIKRSQVYAGDKFSLWINGKEVTSKSAKKRTAITLMYKKTSKYKAGKTIEVQVGVQRAYGQGDDRQVSSNVILSNVQKVTIK